MDSAERHQRIAEAAYFRAEQRGFRTGAEVEDWLEAERVVDAFFSRLHGQDPDEAPESEDGPKAGTAESIAHRAPEPAQTALDGIRHAA